jgi:hypothetical protein
VGPELIIKLFTDFNSRQKLQLSIYQQDGSLHSGVLDRKLGNGPDILTFHLGKFQSIHIQISTIHIKWVPKKNTTGQGSKHIKILFEFPLVNPKGSQITDLEIQRFRT